MSREIKFRAWDSKYKCMDYNFFISNLGGVFGEPEKYYDTPNMEIDEAQNLTAMQYTGLKDKNGKEIYCGDTIKGRCDLGGKMRRFIGVVNINLPSITVKGVKQYSWKTCHSINDVRQIEIIGNIYENPELLKESK